MIQLSLILLCLPTHFEVDWTELLNYIFLHEYQWKWQVNARFHFIPNAACWIEFMFSSFNGYEIPRPVSEISDAIIAHLEYCAMRKWFQNN